MRHLSGLILLALSTMWPLSAATVESNGPFVLLDDVMVDGRSVDIAVCTSTIALVTRSQEDDDYAVILTCFIGGERPLTKNLTLTFTTELAAQKIYRDILDVLARKEI